MQFIGSIVACARNGSWYSASTFTAALAIALSTSPILWATAPALRVASSSSLTIFCMSTAPCGPSSHSICQRRQALLGRAHVVGNDGHGVVEPHDLADAVHRLGGGVVDAFDLAAEHRRLCQGRDLHARRPGVDAIDGPFR